MIGEEIPENQQTSYTKGLQAVLTSFALTPELLTQRHHPRFRYVAFTTMMRRQIDTHTGFYVQHGGITANWTLDPSVVARTGDARFHGLLTRTFQVILKELVHFGNCQLVHVKNLI